MNEKKPLKNPPKTPGKPQGNPPLTPGPTLVGTVSKKKGGRPRGKEKPKPLFYDLTKKGFDVSVEFLKLYQEADLEKRVDLFKTALKYIYAVPAPIYQKVEATQNNLTINSGEKERPKMIESKRPALKELMSFVKNGQTESE